MLRNNRTRSVAVSTAKYLLPLLLLLLPFLFFDRGTRMQILLGDGDTFVHTLPVWTYVGEQWKSLSPPLWTPHIFSGYPLYAEPQTAAFHPTKLLFLFLSPLAAVNITVLLAYGMAGVWTFLLARAERLTFEASFLAGFAFAFSGYLVGHQAMTGLLVNAAWFPALFFVLRRLATVPTYLRVAGGTCVILLLVLGGHPQLTFYALFFSLGYALFLAIFHLQGSQRWAFVRAAAAMYLTGISISAFQWVPTLELSSRTFREKLTYEIFANPAVPFPSLVVSLISTRLFHRFPGHGSETMLDVGFPILLLSALGLMYWRRATAWWAFLLVFGSILYMGATTPLYRIMFAIPGYNLFRIPSRNGIAIELALAMLAAYGVNAVQTRSRPLSRYLIVGAPLALVLLYYFGVHRIDEVVFSRIWWSSEGKTIDCWNAKMLRDVLLPLAGYLAMIAVSLLLMAVVLSKCGRSRATVLVMLGISFAHFWSYRDWIFVASRQEVDKSLSQAIPLPACSGFQRTAFGASGNWISFLNQDPKNWHQRYAGVAGPDFSLLQRAFSISGYSPLVRRDYSRLAGDMTTSGTIQNSAVLSSQTLDLLGVKYVIAPKELSLPDPAFSSLQFRSSDNFVTVYENPRAFPMFWGISRVEPGSIEQFWARMASGQLDVARETLLTQQPPPQLKSEYALPKKVEMQEVSGNRVKLRVETEAESFLASSQLAYPGWRASIDGRSAPLYEINGLFLGLEIPPGRHEIHLRFIPLTLCIGLLFAGVVVLLLTYAARRNLLRLSPRGQEP
jgi:hypothetical protein